jgi:hypothetical protein
MPHAAFVIVVSAVVAAALPGVKDVVDTLGVPLCCATYARLKPRLDHHRRGGIARPVPDHKAVAPARDDASPMLSTLDKGLRVLEALARSDTGSESLTSLSRAVGIHRTTVFRILGTLRARGYVSRESDTDRYRLGVRVLSLAGVVLDNLDIRQVARSALHALRRDAPVSSSSCRCWTVARS